MRRLIKWILSSIMLMSIGIMVTAQDIQKNENEHLFKISGDESIAPVKNIRSEPMVIGPDLYNQMGELSNYYALCIAYTSDNFKDFEGFSADDFIVATGETMEIKYVRSTYYSPFSLDSIANFNVIFYSDDSGKPGTIVKELAKQTNVYYESYITNSYVFDATVTLSENVTLSEGKYWVSIQPVTEIVEPNAYGQPGMWIGSILQVKADAINSQAHVKNPGTGYFPLSDWSSMTTYWNTMQGVDYELYNLNFGLYGHEKDYDLALSIINTPESGAELTTNETILITIQNHGLIDVADDAYQVRFRVNEGTWSDLENGKAVPSGSEILYTLHDVADLSVKGVYNVEVEILYDDDENNDNNILVKSVENYGVLYPAISGTTVVYETCEGTFTDNGGLENTLPSSRDTVVFKPGTAGSRIRLEFYNTDMTGAYPLQFYNGSSVNSPQLGVWESLDGSTGIYTQEVNNLIIEGANSEGAITVVIPGFYDSQGSINNFMARVLCVKNENTDFKVTGVETSKPYSWENETIELTAMLESRGLVEGKPLVTFFVDGTELTSSVSTTTMEFGEIGNSTTEWTPTTAGIHSITAKVPVDDGLNSSEKEFTIEHEIYPAGYLVEGFELEKYPPEGWQNRVQGGTNRYFVWYNDRPYWEGKWNVSISRDTLITPKLDIEETDTIEFIYSAGFFGGTCNIIYAPTLEGPWKVAHTVSYGLPFAKNYKATLKRAVGANYIGFDVQGGSIDFVRGPQLHINEFDLANIEFTGAIDPLINTEVNYDFKIRNMGDGTLSGSDYSVKLWKEIDGVKTEIASLPGVDILFSNYYTFSFSTTFIELEVGNIYATIDYSADEDITNNTSEMLDLDIVKGGVEYIYIGSEESTLIDQYTISGFGANYAEMIYTKEVVGVTGEISGLSVYYDGFRAGDVDLQIFVGETDLNNLEDGFLSTSALDMVADGTYTMDFTDQPFKQIYIPFEKPYLYSGDKNLVVAFYRTPFDACADAGFMPSFALKATGTDNSGYVSYGMQCYERDTDVSNPDEINSMRWSTKKFLPNIQFYVKTTEMDASLSGTVTDEASANLEGVTLSLNGFANTTKTAADGTYGFPVMPYGDIDVMAEFYGYYNDTITGTFTATNETVVNFTMEALPTVEVYGNIIANDSLKPISGVEVYMTGYDLEFYDVTGIDGKFILDGVYGDKEYEITFTHPKYVEQSITISVPYESLDVGTITMDELETPAFNIIAEINDNNAVGLTWQTPYTGVERMVDPTLGTEFGSYWYNEPDEDVQLGNLFRVNKPGTVTSLEFSNYAWQGASSAELYLRFYNKDRVEIMKPVSFMMPDSTVDWMKIDVPNFTYTEDFYVMIHWNKVHQQTSAIMSHLHDDNVAYLIDGGGNWMLLTDLVGPTHSGAFSLRANVLEEGTKASKALISYDLWRTEVENSSDPGLWTKMNSEPIAGTGGEITYTDETFSEVNDGYYLYAVQANYTKATSPYAYSNDINKGMFVRAIINVTANNDQDITGALVTLSNSNGAAINTYFDALANGKVEFNRVLKGNYQLEITKGAAYWKFETNMSMGSDTTINVELIEYIFTPTMLQVDTNLVDNAAVLSWGLGDEKIYQVDDGTAEQALGIGADGDAQLGNFFNINEAGQIYSLDILAINDGEGGKVSIIVYDADQEILGKTTELVIEADDEGTFFNVPINFIEYKGAFYVMVKYSSDETLAANSLPMDTDDDPGSAFYYDAENGFVQLANWGYYGNFMIRARVLVNGKKSIVIPSAQVNMNASSTVSEYIVATDIKPVTAKSGARSVLSYNIFLDDMTTAVAEGVTSQSFTFNENDHLTIGGLNTYTAGVQAVFATGNSIVVPINFDYDRVVSVIDNVNANLVVYPNPATNNITVTHTENSTIEFYSAVGNLVKTITENNTISTISVADLANGTYIIKVKFAEGNIYRNLIINR